MDLPQLSVVLSGVDRWDVNYTERVLEPRLLGSVRQLPGCQNVVEFRTPPWEEETANPFDQWANVGVPVYPFPRWLRCTRCNLLSPVDRERFQLDVPAYRPDRARYYHDRCNNGRPSAVPARFLIACPAGHLDDFPWVEYVHHGDPCPGAPILELHDSGKANRATDVRVTCKACGAERHVQEAFSIEATKSLPLCRGGGTRISSGLILAATNRLAPSCLAHPTPGSPSTAPHSRSPRSPATSSRGSQIIGTIWQRSIVVKS